MYLVYCDIYLRTKGQNPSRFNNDYLHSQTEMDINRSFPDDTEKYTRLTKFLLAFDISRLSPIFSHKAGITILWWNSLYMLIASKSHIIYIYIILWRVEFRIPDLICIAIFIHKHFQYVYLLWTLDRWTKTIIRITILCNLTSPWLAYIIMI